MKLADLRVPNSLRAFDMRVLAGNNHNGGNGHADHWLTPEEVAEKFSVINEMGLSPREKVAVLWKGYRENTCAFQMPGYDAGCQPEKT